MIWLILFTVSLAVNLYLIGGLFWLRSLNAAKSDHAKCIAHVSSVVSNRVVANAFYDAADRWDSIEGQADLRRIGNTKWVADNSAGSVPALWLREQADRIEAGQ